MIRTAKSEDARKIAALWNWMISETLLTFTTDQKSVEDIDRMIFERGNGFLVSETDEGIEGFASFGAFRSGPGYARTAEHSVIVAQNHIGRGVGRALMSALMDRARAEGVHIIVAAISSENPRAVEFHTRLGFEEVGRMPEVGYKNDRYLDLILMQKMLSNVAS